VAGAEVLELAPGELRRRQAHHPASGGSRCSRRSRFVEALQRRDPAGTRGGPATANATLIGTSRRMRTFSQAGLQGVAATSCRSRRRDRTSRVGSAAGRGSPSSSAAPVFCRRQRAGAPTISRSISSSGTMPSPGGGAGRQGVTSSATRSAPAAARSSGRARHHRARRAQLAHVAGPGIGGNGFSASRSENRSGGQQAA
jgi:hypothetical protein